MFAHSGKGKALCLAPLPLYRERQNKRTFLPFYVTFMNKNVSLLWAKKQCPKKVLAEICNGLVNVTCAPIKNITTYASFLQDTFSLLEDNLYSGLVIKLARQEESVKLNIKVLI